MSEAVLPEDTHSPLVGFDFDGKSYLFNSVAASKGTGLIRLPDGRHLLVEGWQETYPPRPVGLREVPHPKGGTLIQTTEAILAPITEGKNP
jgi:hypothetical protein